MISVKYKLFRIIFIILIIVLLAIATFFVVKGLTMEDDSGKKNSTPSITQVDVDKIIEDIKAEHTDLVYESEYIPEFKSLIFKENDRITSFVIDTNTGENLSLEEIIKDGYLDDFEAKELELLKLKYPMFIIDGITNTEGYKAYFIKDNELTIYYYDYIYEYDYKEEVSLTINYNEIHDYLDFTHLLDEEYENENGYNYSKDKKTVAITFDDGPSSKYNGEFLRVLEENKAHATFFMTGTMMYNCQKCVLNTYNSGNEVASHTYNHINIKNSSIAKVNENIKKTDDLFYSITGSHIKYVRPPYGSYSKENLENVAYPLILWNLDTEDWRYHDVDHIVNYVMDNVSDGSIILMHELYETSLQALEILLPKLYAEGYQVVSISELATLQDKTLERGHAYRAMMN